MIEEIITQFRGKTFSNHEEVISWLKEKLISLENKIREVINISNRKECDFLGIEVIGNIYENQELFK